MRGKVIRNSKFGGWKKKVGKREKSEREERK